MNKPKIICYCGSLKRAREAFKEYEYLSVLRGEIPLLPACIFLTAKVVRVMDPKYLDSAEELHKRKIDICDEVMILNVGGYIGESTQSELDYAREIGKPVKFLEPIE